MVFNGVSKVFRLTGEEQYETIGRFWDEIAEEYGLENLQGLGYNWRGNEMSYAIGLKNGDIRDFNVSIELPEEGWTSVSGETDRLKELYDEIYKEGKLRFEIETFFENGTCQVRYYR